MTTGAAASPNPVSAPERRWWSTAGAWLAIGTSPAAVVLGAGVADRHDGPVPLAALLLGGAAMAVLLLLQGRLGLLPPRGEGRALADILDSYLPPRDRTLVAVLLALAMVGWLGFNAGLGGAALASLLGSAQWVGVGALGIPLLGLALAGQHRWNGPAILTTAAALALLVLVAAQSSPAQSSSPDAPVTAALGSPALLLADVSVFVGYVSVFALRAPDFTAGLRGRGDLWACTLALVVPTLVAAAAGTTIALSGGSTDLVAHLQTSTVGTTLVVVAVAAPALTAYHSGGLALRSVTRSTPRQATLVVGIAGLLLATSGFERVLLPWLTVLAAVLPPLIIPLAVEARARRRDESRRRRVSPLTWQPAAALGIALTVADVPGAALIGLAAAGASTALARRFRPR